MEEVQCNRECAEDNQIFIEKKCSKCTEVENKLVLDGPSEPGMTKKERRHLEKSLYRKMIDDGFLQLLVDTVATLCPQNVRDLEAFAQLLLLPKPGEAVDLDTRYESVVKLKETIRVLKFSHENEVPLELRLDGMAKRILQDTRQLRKKDHTPTETRGAVSVKFREHVCNEKCPWCRLHCEDLSSASRTEGEMCNNDCVIMVDDTSSMSEDVCAKNC